MIILVTVVMRVIVMYNYYSQKGGNVKSDLPGSVIKIQNFNLKELKYYDKQK